MEVRTYRCNNSLHARDSVRPTRVKDCIVREATGPCWSQVVNSSAAPAQASNDVDWIERLVED